MAKDMIIELADLDTPPYWIGRLLNMPQQKVEEALADYDRHMRLTEKHYRETEWPKVQQNIREMVAEVPEAERNEMRRRYLLGQLQEAKKNPKDQKNLQRVMLQVKIYMGKNQGVSPDDIMRARSHPISDFLKSRGGMAKCPFHTDKTPSLDTRKNFYFCYGCGASGDVIDLVMKLENLSFKQAINRLI